MFMIACMISLIFGKQQNNPETVQDRHRFYNRRLIGSRMWPILWYQDQWPWVPLNVKYAVGIWKHLTPIPRKIWHVLCLITICLHINRKAHVTWTFHCLIETVGLWFLKVAGSQVHCKYCKHQRRCGARYRHYYCRPLTGSDTWPFEWQQFRRPSVIFYIIHL